MFEQCTRRELNVPSALCVCPAPDRRPAIRFALCESEDKLDRVQSRGPTGHLASPLKRPMKTPTREEREGLDPAPASASVLRCPLHRVPALLPRDAFERKVRCHTSPGGTTSLPFSGVYSCCGRNPHELRPHPSAARHRMSFPKCTHVRPTRPFPEAPRPGTSPGIALHPRWSFGLMGHETLPFSRGSFHAGAPVIHPVGNLYLALSDRCRKVCQETLSVYCPWTSSADPQPGCVFLRDPTVCLN